MMKAATHLFLGISRWSPAVPLGITPAFAAYQIAEDSQPDRSGDPWRSLVMLFHPGKPQQKFWESSGNQRLSWLPTDLPHEIHRFSVQKMLWIRLILWRIFWRLSAKVGSFVCQNPSMIRMQWRARSCNSSLCSCLSQWWKSQAQHPKSHTGSLANSCKGIGMYKSRYCKGLLFKDKL